MIKILIVEDDKKIAEELSIMLNKHHYSCLLLNDFNNVTESILIEAPNLVLLDVNLPVFDGYYILSELREQSNVPVIIVTSRDSDMDELLGMNLGADDFITKPYNHRILLARISNVINRVYNDKQSNVVSYKDLILDQSRSSIAYKSKGVDLTKNESRIMTFLINNAEHIVSRDEIIECLWQSNEFVDDNTLTVNINRLRNKLKEIDANDMIQTKRGQGYTLK